MKARRLLSTLISMTAVVVALAVLAVLGQGPGIAQAIDLWGSGDDEQKDSSRDAFWTENGANEPIALKGMPSGFADLAEHVSPGVVNIQTSKTVSQQPLPRVFEDFLFRNPGSRGGGKRKVPSAGSGFVISTDGYIVTNNHVIEEVDSIIVLLDNGEEFDARVVGRDPKTDIALIKIDADKKFFALPLGNSEIVRPGEWVVAIGNPFGLQHTVTAGIVSAKHRFIGQGSYDDYIQTDAAINPGNSGGPLLNLSGEVIGINTLINPQANTIGFAVPINMAKDILPQLRDDGRVTRGWLGVMINPVRPEFQEHLNVEDGVGALVSQVLPDGPAARAGIKEYDVIIEFDGEVVGDMNDLPRLVARTRVDKKVKVLVLRDGKRKTLTAKIAAMEDDEVIEVATRDSGASAFGVRVQEVTPEIAQQLGVDGSDGVVVTAVEPGGAASEAGLRRGDIILEVNRAPVNNLDDFASNLDDVTSSALLLIRRGDATLFIALKRS